MSDIISKPMINEELLKGRVYLVDMSPIRTIRYGGKYISSELSTPYYIYSFEHTNRVIAYIDNDGYFYLLGNENVLFDKGVSIDGTNTNSTVCQYHGTITATITKPEGFTEGSLTLSNVWRIGINRPGSNDCISPPVITDYNYAKGTGLIMERLTPALKSYNLVGDRIKLTKNISSTLTMWGFNDYDSHNYVFNDKLNTYNDAMTALPKLAEDMYLQWVKSPDVTYTAYAPGYTPKDYVRNYVCANLIITHSLKSAQKYLEDGTIPDDAVYSDPATPPTVNDDIEGGDPNNITDGSSGSDHRDAISLNAPTQSAGTMCNNYIYTLEKSQLLSFISDMWDFTWTELASNMLTGIYSNLIDNVQSIRLMPFSPGALGTVTESDGIQCGWWKHEATVNALTPNNLVNLAGNYDLTETFGGWADYSPYTSAEIFLPYLGWMDIDTNLFMGHTIKVEYTLDVLCGIITYYISCDKTFVMTKSAKVACDIPISLTSGIDVFSDIAKNVGGAVSNVANARPIGLISGSAQVTTPKLVGDATESGKLWMPTKCAIRITRPAYTRASNYASRYGYPCYGSYKLSSLKGFTVVENYKSHYTKGIKKEEEDMIKNMMESGVYL